MEGEGGGEGWGIHPSQNFRCGVVCTSPTFSEEVYIIFMLVITSIWSFKYIKIWHCITFTAFITFYSYFKGSFHICLLSIFYFYHVFSFGKNHRCRFLLLPTSQGTVE